MKDTAPISISTVERSSPRARWNIAVPVSFVVALPGILVLAMGDTARFRSTGELSHLTFGFPLGWLRQDQSASDPPIPGSTRFGSPWERPFSVDYVPLLLNIAIAMAALLITWACVVAIRSRLLRGIGRLSA